VSTATRGTGEEIANAVTHGIGAFASVAAGAVLITLAAIHGDVWHVVGASIYVVALVLLFTASTLYHSIPHPRARGRLKIFDHCAIYLLIAGTYTPFTLVGLRGGWGWALFGTIWTLALVGIFFKLFYTGRFRFLSTAIYVAMGWMVIVAAEPLVRNVPEASVYWLVIGGILYTAGAVFHFYDRVRFFHPVWHLFVLAGAVSHFVAVFNQVAMPGV